MRIHALVIRLDMPVQAHNQLRRVLSRNRARIGDFLPIARYQRRPEPHVWFAAIRQHKARHN